MKHGVLKKWWFAVLLCLSLYANAQRDSLSQEKEARRKPVFHSITTAGLLAGASGRDFLWQTIGGASYNTWFAGAGAGVDYYFLRSLPLFLDVRKTFSKAHAGFVYADAGWNIPWQQKKDKRTTWFQKDVKTGIYYDLGAGAKFKMHKQQALVLAIGYSVKTSHEIRTAIWESAYPPSVTKIKYDLRRISIKVGFQF